MNQRKWSDREVEILRELYPNPEVSQEDLEKVFNRSGNAILHKAKSLKLRKIYKENIDEEYLEQLRRVIRI